LALPPNVHANWLGLSAASKKDDFSEVIQTTCGGKDVDLPARDLLSQ
jgi:hypothetical protein